METLSRETISRAVLGFRDEAASINERISLGGDIDLASISGDLRRDNIALDQEYPLLLWVSKSKGSPRHWLLITHKGISSLHFEEWAVISTVSWNGVSSVFVGDEDRVSWLSINQRRFYSPTGSSQEGLPFIAKVIRAVLDLDGKVTEAAPLPIEAREIPCLTPEKFDSACSNGERFQLIFLFGSKGLSEQASKVARSVHSAFNYGDTVAVSLADVNEFPVIGQNAGIESIPSAVVYRDGRRVFLFNGSEAISVGRVRSEVDNLVRKYHRLGTDDDRAKAAKTQEIESTTAAARRRAWESANMALISGVVAGLIVANVKISVSPLLLWGGCYAILIAWIRPRGFQALAVMLALLIGLRGEALLHWLQSL